MKTRYYLIVRGNGEKPRVVGSRQTMRLRDDEAAFAIDVVIPATWGRIYSSAPLVAALPEDAPNVAIGSAIVPSTAEAES